MKREFYLELAERGLAMPIGADLILNEQPDHESCLYDGSLLGKVVVETARRFNTPLALPLMDLTVEKEWMLTALGIPAEEIEEYHFKSCLTNADIAKLKENLPACITERLKTNCRAINYVKDNSDFVPVGMAIGPFSLMVKMVDDPITGVYLAGMGMDDDEVKLINILLELSTEIILESVRLQVESGAEAICICEPAANTVYLSPIQLEDGSGILEKYVMKYNRRISELLESLGADLIFHDCGELTDDMVAEFDTLNPAILTMGASRNLWHDAKLISKETVLFGNLPSKQFYSDTVMPVSKVRSMSAALVESMKVANHPFILGTECDVLAVPEALDSILAKIEAMQSVTGYPCQCSRKLCV